MKAIIAFALFSVVAVALARNIKISNDSPMMYETRTIPTTGRYYYLVRDPERCTSYYVMIFEQGSFSSPVTRFCPNGLHFNDAIKQCDWPDTAMCKIPKTKNFASK